MTDKGSAVGLIRGFIIEEEEDVVDTASRSPLDLIIFCFFPTFNSAQLWINMSRRNEELSRPTLGSRNVGNVSTPSG